MYARRNCRYGGICGRAYRSVQGYRFGGSVQPHIRRRAQMLVVYAYGTSKYAISVIRNDRKFYERYSGVESGYRLCGYGAG